MDAIVNGRIVTVTRGVIERGTILIEDGKITAVGEGLAIPDGARVYNAAGKWVTPGLIDAHTHISTMNEPREFHAYMDTNEAVHPITPHLRAIDALNPDDIAIAAAREAGFTTCYTMPGSSNLIGGMGIAFKCHRASTVYDLVIPGTEMMKMALGQNPIKGRDNKEYPVTRMGNGGKLREALASAQNYMERKEKGDNPPFDFRWEALIPLLQCKMKARIHCHRADDIVTAVRIAREFGFAFSLEHATEGYKITDFLRASNVTCVVGPMLMNPYKSEIWNCRQTTPGILEREGVDFCLTADDASATRWLPTHVGIAMAHGLSEQKAFEAVTIAPARLLGLDLRVGSIEPGKDADIAVFTGHPFSNLTLCEATFIDGELVWKR